MQYNTGLDNLIKVITAHIVFKNNVGCNNLN